MASKVDFGTTFNKELKRLLRKYHVVVDEVELLVGELKRDERPGDKIPNVGYDVYKVRLKNPAAGRGKSGGFRVVYYARLADFVVLISIYAKSEQENMSVERIRRVIEEYVPPDDET